MTKEEKDKCYKVMWEGIRNGREAQEIFKNKRNNISETQMLFAQNKLGYANGINLVLVELGYDHPGMKILNKLL